MLRYFSSDWSRTKLNGKVDDRTGRYRPHSLIPDGDACVDPTGIGDVHEQHPLLRVEVSQVEPETSVPALLAHDFDLVIAEEYPGGPAPRSAQLERRELCNDGLRLARPPSTGLLNSPKDPTHAPRELSSHSRVVDPEDTAARRWTVAVCRNVGFEPVVRFASPDLLVHVRLVEEGLAAALLPDLVWNYQTPSVDLIELPGKPQSRQIFMVTRRSRSKHPAIVACRNAFSEAATAALQQ